MTIGEVKRIHDRVRRIQKRINEKVGEGAEWKAEIPGSGKQEYQITGVKSPEEIEDDVAALAVWIWSMKDYLKRLASSLGRNPNEVERFVNTDPDLPACADLTNRDKHAELIRSRSEKYLRTGRLRYTIPERAVSAVTFRGNQVQIDVAAADAAF